MGDWTLFICRLYTIQFPLKMEKEIGSNKKVIRIDKTRTNFLFEIVLLCQQMCRFVAHTELMTCVLFCCTPERGVKDGREHIRRNEREKLNEFVRKNFKINCIKS